MGTGICLQTSSGTPEASAHVRIVARSLCSLDNEPALTAKSGTTTPSNTHRRSLKSACEHLLATACVATLLTSPLKSFAGQGKQKSLSRSPACILAQFLPELNAHLQPIFPPEPTCLVDPDPQFLNLLTWSRRLGLRQDSCQTIRRTPYAWISIVDSSIPHVSENLIPVHSFRSLYQA